MQKFTPLCLGAVFTVAACDSAPTTPTGDAPDVSAAVLVDIESTANGAADYERLELCKVWEDDTGAPTTPFATTFTVTATTPGGSPQSQVVTIDGTESPTPGCKNVLQFDGTTANYQPADDISIVEGAPPADWAVTDISTTIITRGSGTTGEVNAQASVATRTWTADHADNEHGILVTFTNTFTPPETEVDGRFTGGGSFFLGDTRFTHGFELRCDATDPRQNLEINWLGNQFHLTELTSAACFDDPDIVPRPPRAGLDTYVGEGIGRLNQVDGATIVFTITDAGEPGRLDTMTIEITPPPGHPLGTTPIVVSNYLDRGNHQAHDN